MGGQCEIRRLCRWPGKHWRHQFGRSFHLWQASRRHGARRLGAPLVARSVEAPAEYRPRRSGRRASGAESEEHQGS
jgi:hypothetical protein